MTLAIAHRGASNRFRENTLAALRAAVDAGADAVTVDLQLTADGHVVALYDDALRRFWGSDRPTDRVTLAELAVLGDGGTYRIPTLMEVLAELDRPGSATLLLSVRSAQTALRAEEMVLRDGTAGRYLYSGPPEAMRELRGHSPRAALCLEWDYDGLPPRDLWEAVRPRFLSARWQRLTPEQVAALHQLGYGVLAGVVSDAAGMARLAAMGVDGIVTDRPDELVGVLRGSRR